MADATPAAGIGASLQITDDDFTLLGLPQRFAIDRAQLDERRRTLQAATHPDRFAAEGAAAQRLAMQWAVRINEAHQRLKNPLSRAAYLCELRGAAVQAERNTAMPAGFLMQQMQWREALDEAADAAGVRALADEVQRAEQALALRVAQALDEAREPVAVAAGQVRAWMFVQRFRQDVQARLDALDPVG